MVLSSGDPFHIISPFDFGKIGMIRFHYDTEKKSVVFATHLKIKKQIKPVKFYRLEKLRKIHNLNKITCNILHKCKCFRR